jgi:ABC-type uncharacterized transport system substrate-binding protein
VRRRDFITFIGGVSVAWPLAALAQEPGRMYRVGGLSTGPRNSPAQAAMFDELRRFGFIDGQNLTIHWRQYPLHIDLISEFAADLVKSQVDVIYAVGDSAIRAAQRATTTIPILGTTDDMLEAGLVSVHQITRPEDIPAAVDEAKASGAAALNVLASPVLYSSRQIILQRVAALHLPAIYQFPEEAEEGGFVAYGPSIVQIFRDLTAQQLVKLLRGTKPADIPVEQPTKFELVINLKTATAMGITVPATLVARADKVIE